MKISIFGSDVRNPIVNCLFMWGQQMSCICTKATKILQIYQCISWKSLLFSEVIRIVKLEVCLISQYSCYFMLVLLKMEAFQEKTLIREVHLQGWLWMYGLPLICWQ